MKRLGSAILVSLVLGASVQAAAQQGLDPDFNLRAACPASFDSAALRAVERKLFDDGFDVLDTVVLMKARDPGYPFRVKVEALDKAGRYISATALDFADKGAAAHPFTIHVSLYTRPPTSRDATLESALTTWTETLGCKAQDTDRHVNGKAATETYEQTISDMKNMFKEAREMGLAPPLLLQH